MGAEPFGEAAVAAADGWLGGGAEIMAAREALGHDMQLLAVQPMPTRWPIFSPFPCASEPRARTVPTASWPGTKG